jgi:acyl-CoA thioester hydrolase
MPSLPTLDQLNDLEPAFSLVAPKEYEDYNGHVNVSHHYALHMRACEDDMAALGINTIEGRSLLLARSPKILHGISVLTDVTTGTIASLCEWVELAVDLGERRTTTFPDDIAKAIDERIAQHAALDWSLPLAGPMGPR